MSDKIRLGVSLTAIAIGAAIIAGYIFKIAALVQIAPAFAPVHADAAFGILALGVAFAVSQGKRRAPATLLAAVGAALGGAGLVQTALGTDFGFERWLPHGAAAGHMPPVLALNIVLMAGSIWVYSAEKRAAYRLPACALLGSVSAASGLTTLATGLAVSAQAGPRAASAIGLLAAGAMGILGTGMLAVAVLESRSRREKHTEWTTVIAPVAILTATLILFQTMTEREYAGATDRTAVAAAAARDAINTRLDTDTQALGRMAGRWSDGGRPDYANWRSDAARLIRDSRALQAVEYVDASTTVQWAQPASHSAVGTSLFANRNMAAAANEVRREGRTVTSKSIHLPGGVMGFVSISPIKHAGTFDGFIVGVFSYANLMSSVTLPGTGMYGIAVHDGSNVVYTRKADRPALSPEYAQAAGLQLQDSHVAIELTPSSALLASLRSPLPLLVLFSGLLTVLFSCILTWSLWSARSATGAAVATADQLAEEMARRATTENELRDAREFAESIVNGASTLIYVTDLPADKLMYANEDTMRLIGPPPGGATTHPADFMSRIVAPDSETVLAERDAQLAGLEDGEPCEYEVEVRSNSGDLRWLQVRERVFRRDDDGTPTHIVGAAQDITDRKTAQGRVEAERQRTQTILEGITDGFMMLSQDGACTFCNSEAARLLGRAGDDITGETIAETVPFLGESAFPIEARRAQRDNSEVAIEIPGVGNTGLLSIRIVPAAGGLSVYLRDVTQERQAAEMLRASESRLAEAQRVARIGSWEVDIATGTSVWSDELYRLLDVDAKRTTPTIQTILDKCHHEDRGVAERSFDHAKNTGESFEFDTRVLSADGSLRWHHVIGKGVCDPFGQPIRLFGTLRDVDEERRMARQVQIASDSVADANDRLKDQQDELVALNAKLESLATTDGLTGLRNHRSFQEQLATEVQRARRYGHSLSLMMVDVDEFKRFNDSQGHQAGDEVIAQVAALLAYSLRTSDFVGRYGGDEFVVILPETDGAGATDIAERVRTRISDNPWTRGPITVSVGVATLLPSTANAAALITDADSALYASKSGGRNRVSVSTGPSVPPSGD